MPPSSKEFIDSTLLKSTDLHHEVHGEYRQAVLIDGCSDRPFRLEWPKGTIVFLVGSAQQIAENVMDFPVR